jgi:hypothetical protein
MSKHKIVIYKSPPPPAKPPEPEKPAFSAQKTAAIIAAIEASGLTPLDYMPAVMQPARQPLV